MGYAKRELFSSALEAVSCASGSPFSASATHGLESLGVRLGWGKSHRWVRRRAADGSSPL